ncbi:uncharacterized protein isoform X2 [Musca autumnalis]|uniref:uncharacterized protein isoform X2 n=1 Tax=Musca autumnalis TaxID=221902 RepID=UPI003CEAD619
MANVPDVSITYNEVRIQVPWGHMSGRWYGDEEVMSTLLKHVMDKALKDNGRLLNSANSKEPPSYTFKQLETLLYEGSQQSVDLENCKYILERNITKSELYPDKYYFSRDGRVKYLMEFNPNTGMAIEMAKRICKKNIPYLVIKGGESTNASAKATEIDDYLLANNNKFESYMYPKGTHHLHLNNAKPVAQIIIGFLQKYDTEAAKVIQSKM